MGYHKIQEGQRILFKELDEMLHHLQSGKAKMTASDIVALSSVLQQLEMGKLFKALEKHGGIDQFLDSLLGQDSHGGSQRQVGFGHHYGAGGIMPRRHQPMMPHAEMDMARRRYRTRSDMPHMDYDRYDIHDDMEAEMEMDAEYADMEMARRRRLPPRTRTGRFRRRRTRYAMDMPHDDLDRMDMDLDRADETHNALVNALDMVTRYANPTHRADHRTTGDMRMDNPTGDTRSDGRTTNVSPMR